MEIIGITVAALLFACLVAGIAATLIVEREQEGAGE